MHKRKNLVILPGWSNDSDTLWQYQIQPLTDFYDIQTLVISSETTAAGMAKEVLRRASNKFILLGHSLGGYIAQHVALQAPERVESLILVSTFPGTLSEEQRTFFKQGMLAPLLEGSIAEHWPALNRACIAPARTEDEALLALLVAGQKLSREELINQTNVLKGARDISDKLSAINVPTLIIYGRQDQLFTMSMQEQLFDKLSNCTVNIIENCGHMPSLEQPEMTTKILKTWLRPHQCLGVFQGSCRVTV
ncbi:alpha/beta fold hydrolase [Pseudomonas chlororaphis]|uniref:alpha/beta fold hydrolase n=1 Tax=Pseudomonas chlororaphis TaxID=587753 RepID=UPI0015DF3B32|nr:alpha/beta hydrolase [Pseudomonas chlororaphis]QLL12577.1 alpha/beta hydrolase [Pseudomonas chlororaphis subsp. aurantiaca]